MLAISRLKTSDSNVQDVLKVIAIITMIIDHMGFFSLQVYRN
jgi:hypothetical protein